MGQLVAQMGLLKTQTGPPGAQIVELGVEMGLLVAQMSHFVAEIGPLG